MGGANICGRGIPAPMLLGENEAAGELCDPEGRRAYKAGDVMAKKATAETRRTQFIGSLVGWFGHSACIPPFGYTCRPAGALGLGRSCLL